MRTSDKMHRLWSRRQFGWKAAAACLCRAWARDAWAQGAGASVGNALRPDVAAIDRERILRAAERYLAEKPAPITELRSARSPGGAQDYFSEEERADEQGSGVAEGAAFTAHRDAVFALGERVAGLAAAQLLTGERRFGDWAATHLRAWFADPATRMLPRVDFGFTAREARARAGDEAAKRPAVRVGSAEGIVELLPLVEVVQAIPFLAAAGSLTDADLKRLNGWFAEYLHWLTVPEDSGPRLAALARDLGDHHATSWMLQVAAYTLFTLPNTGAPKTEDRAMTELRHRFRTVTLRTQISQDGAMRKEISSANPYRESLFNLDMLACLCVLLSTRFDDVWAYQLEDGPGVQVAVARHFPFMVNRSKWPYRADGRYFNQLPGRRVSLLFAARAYQRPEYAALWRSLEPDPVSAEIRRTMPVRQPLLWVRQPPRPVSE